MDNLIPLYQEHLNLQNATFELIDHEDAMVAIVYKIKQPDGTQFILKICDQSRHYFREVYFLNYFADTLPVPRIIKTIEPGSELMGAVLMEYIPGSVLKITDFTNSLAYETGSLLARIHSNHTKGYGDLIKLDSLNTDPRIHFTQKFNENIDECKEHLPKQLIKQCRTYFEIHINLLELADGPCIVQGDFRPGNIIAQNNKIQAIIDWASGRAGFTQEDFISMEYVEWPIDSTSKKSFLAGYASIRPMPNYTAMMPLLCLNKALAVVGFSVRTDTWQDSNNHWYTFNRQFLETFFKDK